MKLSPRDYPQPLVISTSPDMHPLKLGVDFGKIDPFLHNDSVHAPTDDSSLDFPHSPSHHNSNLQSFLETSDQF